MHRGLTSREVHTRVPLLMLPSFHPGNWSCRPTPASETHWVRAGPSGAPPTCPAGLRVLSQQKSHTGAQSTGEGLGIVGGSPSSVSAGGLGLHRSMPASLQNEVGHTISSATSSYKIMVVLMI